MQYPVIHEYAAYDLEVDTALLSADECAVKIIGRLKSPPGAFKSLIPK